MAYVVDAVVFVVVFGVSGLCVDGSGFGGFRVVGSGIDVSDVGDFDVDVLPFVPMAHEIQRKRLGPKMSKHNTAC